MRESRAEAMRTWRPGTVNIPHRLDEIVGLCFGGAFTVYYDAQVANSELVEGFLTGDRELIFHHVLDERADTVRPV